MIYLGLESFLSSKTRIVFLTTLRNIYELKLTDNILQFPYIIKFSGDRYWGLPF